MLCYTWFVIIINISLYIFCCTATLYKQSINLNSKELKDIFGELGCIEGFLMAVPISNTSASSSKENFEEEKLDRFKNLTINAKSLKDKTPMCLVNELARHNKIQHQYRLTNEQGLPHKKKFSVTLRLGDEEYSAVGGSIKKGQHAAAAEALRKTKYSHPPPKFVNVNRANTTPCVELNTIAMKMGENPNYEFINYPKTSAEYSYDDYSGEVYQPNNDYQCHTSSYGTYDNVFIQNVNPTCQALTGYYKIQLTVGKYGPYFGDGSSPQAARHAAAKAALQDIRQRNYIAKSGNGKGSSTNDGKSPISIVHEKGLKINMLVNFEVIEEKGPPHMRVYKTECTVGPNLIAVAEGLGKKESKKKAAEKMLELLNTIPESKGYSRKQNAGFGGKTTRRSNYKKRKNIVKDPIPKTEEGDEIDNDEDEEENAISKLHAHQQMKGVKEPVYVLIDEQGNKVREYFIEVRIDQHKFTAHAPSKKEAKRKAAEGMLEMLGIENTLKARKVNKSKEPGQAELAKEVRETNKPNLVGRQLVPGLLLVPSANMTQSEEVTYQPRNSVKNRTNNATDFKKSYNHNAVRYPSFDIPSSSNAGTQDALVHTASSFGYQVQFSDFPNRLSNNYLSMVSMNTNPQHICYGEGVSLDLAREVASRRAFRMLDPYYRNDGHRLYGGMVNYSPYKMKL